jgi:hypothetical protein
MKLKNKVIGTILGVIASSFVFISVPITANAADCSAEDPCNTYAVVDNGVVTNIIVCQPSVCGSGIFDGKQVVLQKPANPTTHQAQGGYFNIAPNPGEPDRRVTYNTEQKTFTQEGTTWSAPQTNTEIVETTTATGAVETTTLTAVINPDGSKETNTATISATENNLVETKFFDQPKNIVEFEESIQDSSILKKHLNKFLQLLRGWIIA